MRDTHHQKRPYRVVDKDRSRRDEHAESHERTQLYVVGQYVYSTDGSRCELVISPFLEQDNFIPSLLEGLCRRLVTSKVN